MGRDQTIRNQILTDMAQGRGAFASPTHREPTGSGMDIERIPAKEIKIPEWQHVAGRYSEARVKTMLKKGGGFREDWVGVIIVNRRRDGTIVAIDGNHRVGAAIIAKGGDYLLTCLVHLRLEPVEEFHVFTGISTVRTGNSRVERFLSALSLHEQPYVQINMIVESRNLKITKRGGHGQIKAVEQLEELFPRNLLAPTLDIVIKAFGTSDNALDGLTIISIGNFIDKYREVDHDVLAKTLTRKFGRARDLIGGHSSPRDFPEICRRIMDAYNRTPGRRTKLEPRF